MSVQVSESVCPSLSIARGMHRHSGNTEGVWYAMLCYFELMAYPRENWYASTYNQNSFYMPYFGSGLINNNIQYTHTLTLTTSAVSLTAVISASMIVCLTDRRSESSLGSGFSRPSRESDEYLVVTLYHHCIGNNRIIYTPVT